MGIWYPITFSSNEGSRESAIIHILAITFAYTVIDVDKEF